MLVVLNIVVPFVIGCVLTVVGYIIGVKHGKVQGMKEFLSIIKVYDKNLSDEIGSLLHNINQMSHHERSEKFRDYIQRYMGGVED